MAPDLDRAGRSPLHYAALDGDLEEVERLLAAGASPSLADRAAGFTPLHFAARAAHAEIARALLDHGAYPDCADARGVTPRHLLQSVDRYALRRLLVR